MSARGCARASDRMIVVCRADPTGLYDWIPPPAAGELTIALDGIAYHDLASRRPLLFDELESWQELSAAEHRVAELLVAIREHPAVAAVGRDGHPLIDFVELRLRGELARLLRGWALARAGAGELICDPAAPPALTIGLRAGLGLDPASVAYAVPPALPGSRATRALARPLMRALAAGSKPERVRIAAVVAGKLSLALAALAPAELHAAGVGAMPFPGLDHGNGALLALRRRLPLLATYGPRERTDLRPAVPMPARLGLDDAEPLDRAITVLVGRLLRGARSEFAQALAALAGLERASSLRALLVPSAGYGASRLLIGWARQRGLRVGSMQHGIYCAQDVEYGERLADVLLGWGRGTAEQTRCWPDPRPRVLCVGLPGALASPQRMASRSRTANLGRVLIATSRAGEEPITPATFCETFIDVIAPALERLAGAGVKLELRPHPSEDPARYRRLLDVHGLDVRIMPGGPFTSAAAGADILISSTSSVAFEAAVLGLPVLMWLGSTPRWVRREHLVTPWTDNPPGTFEVAKELTTLVDGLLEHPTATFAVAHELGRRLARFAEPFRPDRFAEALHSLAA